VLTPRLRAALVVLAASAGLGACTNFGPYGGVGVGVGSGYDGYGYDRYGYSPYGYGYSPYGYNRYGYGYYPAYYGWYNGFYYPGSGYWIYDPDGNQHPITERQSSYWAERLKKFRERQGTTTTTAVTQNWSAFSRQAKVAAPATVTDRAALSQIAEGRRLAKIERQQVQVERQQARAEAQSARIERQSSIQQQVQERREARRARRSGGE